ncbi:MAG: M16 family metallopeptidase [Chloroflexota bacterium]
MSELASPLPHGVTRVTLSNGLLVLLKEIHTAPIISHWVWYRVGSRNERPGQTGISHWVEHMQFKGTPQFPAGVLDRAISRLGGFWNAFTYLDWTTYLETLPAEHIDLALRLEADRMAGSLFNPGEVDSERSVIISERQGSENEPTFRLTEEVQAAAFRVHSYHHEIIGDLADLQSITRDELYQHYRTYYAPNNAVLALAGDFDTPSMLERIRQLYEPIAAAALPQLRLRHEPPQPGERRVTVEGAEDITFLQVAYHAPAAADPDFIPMLALDSLLCGPANLNMFSEGLSNKTSRLYKALVESGMVVSLSGGMNATIDPYLYSIDVTLRPDRQAGEVLDALDGEIARLQDELLDPAELSRAVKQARALFAYGSERITNQAFWLGFSEMFAGYDWYLTYLDHLAQVTPLDVQRVARAYLRPGNRVVGVYRPAGQAAEDTAAEDTAAEDTAAEDTVLDGPQDDAGLLDEDPFAENEWIEGDINAG